MSLRTARTRVILNITNLVLHIFLNILFYTFVILAIGKLSTAAFDFTYQVFGNETVDQTPGRDVTILIKKGESTMNVASKLEINRIIENKYSFYLKTKLTKQNLMPGAYVVNSSMTYADVINTLSDYSKSLDKQQQDSKNKTKADSGTK